MNIKNNHKPHIKRHILGAIIFLYFLGAFIFFVLILPTNNPANNNDTALASPTLIPAFGDAENTNSLKTSTENLMKIITEEKTFYDDPQPPECELVDDVCGVTKRYIDKINDDFKISAKNLANKNSCSNFPAVGSQDYEEWKAGTYQVPFLIDKNIAAGFYSINKANWIKLSGRYEGNLYCCLPYPVK